MIFCHNRKGWIRKSQSTRKIGEIYNIDDKSGKLCGGVTPGNLYERQICYSRHVYVMYMYFTASASEVTFLLFAIFLNSILDKFEICKVSIKMTLLSASKHYSIILNYNTFLQSLCCTFSHFSYWCSHFISVDWHSRAPCLIIFTSLTTVFRTVLHILIYQSRTG